jgi:peptidyl-prolyl cis-trans isomerase A (cyclophilin A)
MVKKLTLAVLTLGVAAVAANPVPALGQSKDKAKGNPIAIFHTTAGDMKCELFPSKAPKTVANFIGLATGTKEWTSPASGQKQTRPLYDGTIFHRVIPNFMIQGGDPLGQGIGGPGYKFEDEFDSSVGFSQPGRLAMANSGPNTNGSQFFITEVPTPHLNGKHTIFGQCDDYAVDLVKKIARMPAPGTRPTDPVKINHIEIIMPGEKAKPAAAPKAETK